MPATVNSNRAAVALAVLLLTSVAGLYAEDLNGDGLETILLPLAFHPVPECRGTGDSLVRSGMDPQWE